MGRIKLGAIAVVLVFGLISRPTTSLGSDDPFAPSAAPTQDGRGPNAPFGAATVTALDLDVPAPAGLTPSEAALWQLVRLFPSVPAAQLVVTHVHPVGKGHLVVLSQWVRRVRVHPHRLAVVLAADGRIQTLSGAPAQPAIDTPRAKTRPDEALAVTLSELWSVPFAPAMFDDSGPREGGYTSLDLNALAELATGIVFRTEARVRPIWYTADAGLRLAYEVEVDTEVPGDTTFIAFNYIIDASDGAVLVRRDLVHDAEMRLWVDDDLRPLAGPHVDFHPHPTGLPDGSVPAFADAELVTLTPFNTNPLGGSDPWLATNASATTGNHIDAYLDLASPNGFGTGDSRPAATSPDTFDYLYNPDEGAGASGEQLNASVLTMFHVANWMHDWYYDSGFTERNGNAQQSNYGRGGFQNDRIIGEAQDYALAQNASMTTPGDGASPRLQVGNWPVPSQARVETGKSQFAPAGPASFGPQTFDITGPIVAISDSGGVSPSDACEALTHDVVGAIALIDRGTCTFAQKATRALEAGAIGVIMANTSPGGLPSMAGSGIDIPTVSITFEHATALRAELNEATTTGRLVRTPPSTRPGTLDAAIIAHEWTHQLHIRLVYCASPQCLAQSEGWADFGALHMLYEEDDDPRGTYAVGIFSTPAVSQDPGYFGIRRYPYSARLDRNPLTFKHIQQSTSLPTTAPRNAFAGGANTLPHRAGEVWASMLWQAYMTLIEDTDSSGRRRLAYADARRRMSDYVVAGMNLAPVDPDYLNQRDAVLHAARARDVADWLALAGGFALRGAGSCAVAAPRSAASMEGVVEDFTLAAKPIVVGVTLTDDRASCDNDAQLDAGEQGHLTLRIVNDGPAPLEGATLTLVSTQAAVALDDETPVAVPTMAPGEEVELSFGVALADDLDTPINVAFTASFTSDTLCGGTTSALLEAAANHRILATASTTEDFEAGGGGWTAVGSAGIWGRELAPDGTHVARGLDSDRVSSARLVSPPMTVGTGGPLIVSWDHSWSFEFQAGATPIYYDGGVVEVSMDNGNSWRDISTYAVTPYPGKIASNSTNSLSNRLGFVGESPDFPALQTISLDLGTALTGRTILLGWRIGTDLYAGGVGWLVDRITVSGLSAAPFQQVAADLGPTLFFDGDGDSFGAGPAAAICPVVDGWVTNDEDCDDSNDEISPDDPERCNGVDDDCDGDTDEGFDVGGACATGVGACRRAGVVTCDEAGAPSCSAEAGAAALERCDGLDNDCDGDTDEDYGLGDVCTAGTGVCQRMGVGICGADGGLGCSATAGSAGIERCNGLDDDCDGGTDEDFDLDVGCTVGIGECQNTGLRTCLSDGSVGCAAIAGLPAAAELCDDRDNDCDGDTDEGFDLGEPCESGSGGCRATGERICLPGGTAGCSVSRGDGGPETCDGVDNDCDGDTDEDLGVGAPCEVGVGACRSVGTTGCGPGGDVICSATALAPSDELCDGRDNDCDGDTDEDLGVGDPCEVGVGVCARTGTIACQTNGQASCTALAGAPADERCDGLDNDCDGDTDEDLTCDVEPQPEPGPEPGAETAPDSNGSTADAAASTPDAAGGDLSVGIAGAKTGCSGGQRGPSGWLAIALMLLGLSAAARRRRRG